MGNRLPGRCYKAVFANARAARGRFCVAYVAPASGGEPPMAGTIATKKTFRPAVARNRAKRLMREAFRLEAPALPQGFKCILIARAGMRPGTSMQEVRADLNRLFRKSESGAASAPKKTPDRRT